MGLIKKRSSVTKTGGTRWSTLWKSDQCSCITRKTQLKKGHLSDALMRTRFTNAITSTGFWSRSSWKDQKVVNIKRCRKLRFAFMHAGNIGTVLMRLLKSFCDGNFSLRYMPVSHFSTKTTTIGCAFAFILKHGLWICVSAPLMSAVKLYQLRAARKIRNSPGCISAKIVHYVHN